MLFFSVQILTFSLIPVLLLDKDDVLEDSDFEKGILESTKIYEVEIGDDGETELVLLDEYVGKVPSKKWLASDKVCIIYWNSPISTVDRPRSMLH